MRILLADDDNVSLKLHEKVVSKWGYDVETANDGYEAWSILSREDNAPKLAVVDWEMPGMEGIELCNIIKSKMNTIGFVYLIMLTSREDSTDIISGLDAGADAYLVKPIDKAELKSRIAVGERTVKFQRKLQDRYHKLHDDLDKLDITLSMISTPEHSKKNILLELDKQMKSQLQTVFKELNFLQTKLLSFDIDKKEKGDLVSLISSMNSNLASLNLLLDTSADI